MGNGSANRTCIFDKYSATFYKHIKVFLKDGDEYYLPAGSTTLDLAFALHTDFGMHFSSTVINNHTTEVGPYYVLNPGDKVIIKTSEKSNPKLKWFRYCNSAKAKDKLVRYFQELYEE